MSYIKNELNRLLDTLKETDPRTTEYINVLRAMDIVASDNFDALVRYADAVDQPKLEEDYAVPDETPEAFDKITPISRKITEPDVETGDELPADVQEITEEPVENGSYTEDDIKQALYNLRRDKNVNISELIRTNFGCNGWKDLPAKEYPKLMNLIRELENA